MPREDLDHLLATLKNAGDGVRHSNGDTDSGALADAVKALPTVLQ